LRFTGSVDQLLGVTKRLRELGATPTVAAHTAPLGGASPKPNECSRPITAPASPAAKEYHIMSDTRTAAEIAYDSQCDGSAYVKPQQTEERSPLFYELKAWMDEH
jgi:hypothetical protein